MPDQPEVLQGDAALPFAELDARVTRMVDAPADLDVRAGDRVTLMFGNAWRLPEAGLGLMRLGAASTAPSTNSR
jgi:acyl-coenzyme A synthetase/AMP-(fatty) acid ligase